MAKCLFAFIFFSILLVLFFFFVCPTTFSFCPAKISDLAGHISFSKRKTICSPDSVFVYYCVSPFIL